MALLVRMSLGRERAADAERPRSAIEVAPWLRDTIGRHWGRQFNTSPVITRVAAA